MEVWEEKRILILGITYPAYSRKYDEVACTGGILEGTFEMVRLHPVPHRYLEPGNRFKSFQWIRAEVARHSSDPRPESLRIKPGSIKLENVIPPSRPEERVQHLEKSPHMCRSVEALLDRQANDQVSLGIIKPQEITGYSLEDRGEAARLEWKQKEKEILSQRRLFGDEIKPIDFPETRFKVHWRCDDPRCEGHKMSLSQWGIHELNRKYRGNPERKEKLLEAMRRTLDQKEKDIYQFLGNFRGVQYNFGLMDSYSAPRVRQAAPLF